MIAQWYEDVPNRVYHGFEDPWQGVTSSGMLGRALKAPALLTVPQESTAALQTGILVHAAILEPDVFENALVVAPTVRRAGKDNLAIWRTFFERQAELGNLRCSIEEAEDTKTPVLGSVFHDEALFLSDTDRVLIDGIRESLAMPCHAHIAEMLAEDSAQRELSGLCELLDDDNKPHAVKVRFDQITRAKSRGLDLKTCQDASERAFASHAARYHYYARAAMYMDAASVIDGKPYERFTWIAIEKSPPYMMAAYYMDRTSGDFWCAQAQYRRALRIIRECRESNSYPGLAQEEQPIAAPSWAFER